jgi:hypothetical protein
MRDLLFLILGIGPVYRCITQLVSTFKYNNNINIESYAINIS